MTSTSPKGRILVAEDDSAVRSFVARALIHSHYEPVTVNDGIQALEALNRGRYDMLITDIVMPGLDGIALALKVTKDWPHMPVLLMTGYAAERQRAHNLEALIHRVISKPFTLQEFVAVVDEVFEGRTAP